MFKLLKYEIKESSKYFIYSIIGNIIASIILALVIGSIENNTSYDSYSSTTFASLMFLAAFGLFVAAYVGFIFMMITSYRKDLYTDSSYLKFSLPINSFSFLNAKILLLIFWGLIMSVVTIVLNLAVYSAIFGTKLSEIFSLFGAIDISPGSFVLMILSLILSFIEGVILLFACITFVKTYFNSSKRGYIWFLFYILFNFIWSILTILINKLIPYYIVLSDKVSLVKLDSGNFLENISSSTPLLQYNIGDIFIYLILIIGLYLFTVYMLDKKMDI